MPIATLVALAAGLLTTSIRVVFGAPHDPGAFARLLERAAVAKAAGQRSIILFDLDDTLLDTALRRLRILREFSNDADIRRRFPAAAAKTSAPGRCFTT